MVKWIFQESGGMAGVREGAGQRGEGEKERGDMLTLCLD